MKILSKSIVINILSEINFDIHNKTSRQDVYRQDSMFICGLPVSWKLSESCPRSASKSGSTAHEQRKINAEFRINISKTVEPWIAESSVLTESALRSPI